MNKTTLTKFSCMQLNFDLREHEILIKRHKNAGVKYFNDSNTFIACSNTVDDLYENIDDYNPSRKTKI